VIGLFEAMAREFRATGVIYLVERETGALRCVSANEYLGLERDCLLDGWLVRLGSAPAQGLAQSIRAEAMENN
jgi:hypothetical protein